MWKYVRQVFKRKRLFGIKVFAVKGKKEIMLTYVRFPDPIEVPPGYEVLIDSDVEHLELKERQR